MTFYQRLMLNQDFKQFYDKNNLKLSYNKDVIIFFLILPQIQGFITYTKVYSGESHLQN